MRKGFIELGVLLGVAALILASVGVLGAYKAFTFTNTNEATKNVANVANVANVPLGSAAQVQAPPFYLYGSGITSSATSIQLTSFKLSDGVTNITMSNFVSATGYGTLEPGTSKEEQISFRGITQNADGTATLTGVTRGLNFVPPCITVSSFQKSHAGGTKFVLSNTACFYDQFAAVAATTTVTGVWTFATSGIPVLNTAATSSFTNGAQFITKNYADSLSYTGSPNGSLTQKGIYQEATNAQVASGTASGSTGADLIVPNAYFNTVSSATTTVPVTNTSGKLSTGFIDQTAPYTWTGAHIFSATTTIASTGTLQINGTSTFSGTVRFNSPLTLGTSTTIATSTIPLLGYASSSIAGQSLGASFSVLATSTITKATAGTTLLLMATGDVSSGNGFKSTLELDLDGIVCATSSQGVGTSGSASHYIDFALSCLYSGTSAGTHNAHVQGEYISGSASIDQGTLIVKEMY